MHSFSAAPPLSCCVLALAVDLRSRRRSVLLRRVGSKRVRFALESQLPGESLACEDELGGKVLCGIAHPLPPPGARRVLVTLTPVAGRKVHSLAAGAGCAPRRPGPPPRSSRPRHPRRFPRRC